MSGYIEGPPVAAGTAIARREVDQIEEFLARVLPMPGQGRAVGIHYTVPNFKTNALPGKAFHSHRDAAAYARSRLYWMRKEQKYDVDLYVAMALCGMEMTKTDDKGRSSLTATRRREAMVASRTLFADLDVKPDGYATQQDAIDHIEQLVDAGKLPEPTVMVSSGSGLHVHWVLDRELNPTEWYRLGPPLSAYLKTLGVHHDPAVTSDGVRVLRLPNTFNCKKPDAIMPTQIIGEMLSNDIPVAEFERLLRVPMTIDQPTSFLPASFNNVVPFVPVPNDSEFSAGIGSPSRLVDFGAVVGQCPTLAGIHDRGGDGDPEPLWSLAMLAATFAPDADDGRGWAHEFSDKDPRYDHAATDAKFDQKLHDREISSGKIGWPTCNAFAAVSPACATCPRLALGKTPFHIIPTKPAPAPDDLPNGYFLRSKQVWTRQIDKEGDEYDVLVMAHAVRDGYMEKTRAGSAMNFEILHPTNPPERVSLPVIAVNDFKQAATLLGSVGVGIHGNEQSMIRSFFVAYLRMLQARAADAPSRDMYGWTKSRDDTPGFAYASSVHTIKGVEQASVGDAVLLRVFSAVGELTHWKAASDLVMGMKRLDIQTIIASAFAGPLLHFSGHSGVVVSAYTPESGVQKSSAMKVALAVWGDPKKGMSRLDDTANHIGKKLGQLRNVPVYWDEVQAREQAENFAKIAFSLTMGTEKGRMAADTTLRESGSWSTILMVAGNHSIREIMLKSTGGGTAAGVNRLFEFEVLRVPLATSATMASQVIGQLDTNFGRVGELYAAMLGRMEAALPGRFKTAAESFEKAATTTQDERFWVVAAASLYLGAELANTLEGGTLIQFDLPALHAYLVGVILKQRTERTRDVMDHNAPEFAIDVLSRYIDWTREHNSCLETDTVPRAAGRVHPGAVQMRMANPEAFRLMKAPVMHIVHDDGVLRIQRQPFRAWVEKEYKQPLDAVLRTLTLHAGLREVKKVWAGGTQWKGASLNFHELDMTSATTVGAAFDFTNQGAKT